MNPQPIFMRPMAFWIVWKPYFHTMAMGIIFSLIASVYIQNNLIMSPEENFYRQLVLWVDVGIILAIGALTHTLLLKKTSLFFFSNDDNQSPVTTPSLLQEIATEIVNYPVKFCAYGLIATIYGTVLFTALTVTIPFIIHSMTWYDYLAHALIAVSIFIWPLALLQFFVLENLMTSLAAHVSHSPIEPLSVVPISFRMKLLAVVFIPLTSVCILLITILSRQRESELLVQSNIYWLLAGTALYALVVVWLFSRSTLRSVGHMQAYLSDQRPPEVFRVTTDEIGTLNSNFQRYHQRLENLTGQLREWSVAIGHESKEILNTSKYQHVSSSNQASAIAQITTTLEELVHSVNQISEDILRVNKALQNGFSQVGQGKEFIDKTLTSIEQIHSEATLGSQRAMDLSLRMSQIEEVMKIINYITDHTKILAFNAAIETAAAGELGERFGVVATEIRQLAQNISNSTEEIKKIIADVRKATHISVLATEKELKLVQHGKQSAADAQEAFNHIYEMVKQTFESIEHITRAIEQQKTAHEQVFFSIKEIDNSAKEQLAQSENAAEPSTNLQKFSDAIRNALN